MILGSKLGYIGDHDSVVNSDVSTEDYYRLLRLPILQLAPSYIYTGLFPGSEQAVAMIATELEIPYTVLISFKREHYSGRWSKFERERYVLLRKKAEQIVYADPEQDPSNRQSLTLSKMASLKNWCVGYIISNSDYIATNITSTERISFIVKALKEGKSIMNLSSYVQK